MALKTIAECNKSPLWSTVKGLVFLPFRFDTGLLAPANVVAPRSNGTNGSTGDFRVERLSSTSYKLTFPAIRTAASATGTGGTQKYFTWIDAQLNTAQYVSAATFADVTTNNTTTCTLTLSAAPADGTRVSGYLLASMVGIT